MREMNAAMVDRNESGQDACSVAAEPQLCAGGDASSSDRALLDAASSPRLAVGRPTSR